jgi:predicted ABC-type ATPase
MPPISKANQRAVAKYVRHHYDRIEVKVPKGRKDSIQAAAVAVGESLSKYITKATDDRMGRAGADAGGGRTYTIIGGVNGTGKSSLTGVLMTQAADLGDVIDVDKLTAEVGASPLEGGKIALRRISDCLEKGASFTQETTLSGRRTAATASEAKLRGYYVRLYYIGLDTPEECMERIANRVARGGHKISENDVMRRFAGRWDAVKRILPLCDEVRFFDNDNGFAEVAEYRNGELFLKSDQLPAWLHELLQSLT